MKALSAKYCSTKSLTWSSLYGLVVKAAWAFFLAALPLTSFPFLPPAIGGGALVRPLSIYGLILLIPLAILPRLLRRPLPRTLLALLPFVVIATISSLISLLYGIEPALGVTVGERIVRGLATLAIGCAFYLAAAILPQSREDLRFSLRWLYAGFFLAAAWGTVQAYSVVNFTDNTFKWLNKIQRYVSTRRLVPNRVSGMTYEPNWFAEQLTFLLMPWLIASVLTGKSVFPWRWRWITGELILLLWSIAVLPFTFSRAGVINVVALAAASLLFLRPKAPKKVAVQHRAPNRSGMIVRRLLEAGLAVSIFAALIYVAGSKNEFFARIWDYWIDRRNPTIAGYFEYLGFGARMTYSETAWRVYEEFPALGVGLGNYAFYFEEKLPDRPLAYTLEVLRLITPEKDRDRLVTPKNFYVRLLAETGIIGLAAFAAFLIAIFGSALYLWMARDPEERYWGTAGLLGCLAFSLAAFSFDSFALPNMWIVFGLVTAAAFVYRKQPDFDR
jgi:hypothetical protein